MLVKYNNIANYRKRIIHSLDSLVSYIREVDRSIVLVNVNTVFAKNMVYKKLENNNIDYYSPDTKVINKYNSLGDFLRNCNVFDNNQQDILVIDFFENFKYYFDSSFLFASEININRDLFTTKYKGVIIFASMEKTNMLINYAPDFRSCIDYYLDTTKWFCNPCSLPLVKIRMPINTNNMLSYYFKSDADNYKKYQILKQKINGIESFKSVIYEQLLNEINSFSDKIYYYYDLCLTFFETFSTIDADAYFQQERIKLLKSFRFLNKIIFPFANIYFIIAEFMYNANQISDAITFYKLAKDLLNNETVDDNYKSVISLLDCNTIVCKYVLLGEDNSINLINHLERKITQMRESQLMDDELEEFLQNYLLIVDATTKHHTYDQHRDIYIKLVNIDKISVNMFDLSYAFELLLSWEIFVNNNFEINNSFQMLSKYGFMINVQEMIQSFMNADFDKAIKKYRLAKRNALRNNNLQVVEAIKIFKSNMYFLKRESNT